MALWNELAGQDDAIAVFEAAAILGVPLLDADAGTMAMLIRESQGKKALLPRRVRTSKAGLKDDF